MEIDLHKADIRVLKIIQPTKKLHKNYIDNSVYIFGSKIGNSSMQTSYK